jgi:signal transduction histidine kinase
MRFFIGFLIVVLAIPAFAQSDGLSADSTAIVRAQAHVDEFNYAEAASILLDQISTYGLEPEPTYELSLLYFELGNVYSVSGDLFKAKKAYEYGLHLDTELDDEYGIAVLKQRLGLIYMDMGHYKQAFNHFLESNNLAERQQDSLLISYNYHNIGVIYENLENYERAEFYYLESLRLDSLRQDWEGVAIGIMNLGNIVSFKGNEDEAMRLYELAKESAIRLDIPSLHVSALENIATVYDNQGDYPRALEAYQTALYLSRDQKNLESQATILNNMAALYNYLSRHRDAYRAADQARRITESMGTRPDLMTSLEHLSDAEAGLGRIQSAYDLLLQSKQLRDSIYKAVDIQDFIQAELTNSFDRKQELQSALMEAERSRNQLIFGLSILFIVVLVVVLVLLALEFKKSREIFASLKKSEQSRSALFSIMAHDIKNPLAGIIGLSSIIQDDFRELSREEIHTMAARLNTSAQNLNRLLDSLLEWSHVELNMKRFYASDIHPYESVTRVCNLLEEVAKPKNITFSNRIDPNLTVNWDPYLFDSILRNLISNAIKFSYRDGMILITHSQDENEHILSVRDFGPGMDLNVLRKIIYDNEMVSTPGTEYEMGSGLGLLLSRQIAKKNGARLTFGGPFEHGTEVHLRIRLNETAPESAVQEPPFPSAV